MCFILIRWDWSLNDTMQQVKWQDRNRKHSVQKQTVLVCTWNHPKQLQVICTLKPFHAMLSHLIRVELMPHGNNQYPVQFKVTWNIATCFLTKYFQTMQSNFKRFNATTIDTMRCKTIQCDLQQYDWNKTGTINRESAQYNVHSSVV